MRVMEKIIRILVAALTSLITRGHGLQLSLYQEVGVMPDSRLSCGVLSCVEASLPGSTENISSMAIFKTTSTTSDDSSQTTQSVVIASLTVKQPSVTYVSETVKVDGRLEVKQATLRIEMTNQEDCGAEFTCQVKAVDSQGKELVSTSRLLQHWKSNRTAGADRSRPSSESSQNLVLADRWSDKINTLKKILQGQEETIKNAIKDEIKFVQSSYQQKGDVENRIELLEKELKNRLQSFENRLEDKLELLDNKIDAFENRVEDKIENNIGTKLWQLNEKLSARSAEEENFITNFNKVLDNGLSNLKKTSLNIQETNKQILLDMTQNSELTLNATLHSVIKASHEQSTCDNQNQLALQNITKIVTNGHKQLAALADNFLQLDSLINRTTTETQSALSTLHLNADSTRQEDIKSVITAFIMPRNCRKGTVSILSQSSIPYPVIYPSEDSVLDFPYMCDTFNDGGGWIIIQRRTTGNVDFYRDWVTYKKGFGSLDDDFWLGNDNIHKITSSGTYELRVELKYKGKSAYAHYNTFSIGDEKDSYILRLGKYSGTGGESFLNHNGKMFSTYDRDNDLHSGNCAQMFTGAWWYNACHSSNLNGKWLQGSNKGPRWSSFSAAEPVSFSEMKIRRVDP